MNSTCYYGNNLCIQDHLLVLYSHSYSPTVLCHFFKFALSASYLFLPLLLAFPLPPVNLFLSPFPPLPFLYFLSPRPWALATTFL